ncbi:hypothetical protein [Candidatus Formimonas warabiya]|uniref:Uncharacterized protein n=1 Tax=Formimonas warabiya TaxID=1761012 RepID=A0A3G1KP17_FORW1|nr:hypothetical protein [Candidatus Formimonas warabiya]ATW24176.1 hypothetical protein DCMF_04700 [Candidatus Formimonas warabiya]
MNVTNKIKELIESLTALTKQKKIEWNTIAEYMEENRNEVLRYLIINNNRYYDSNWREPHLNEYYSYCAPFMEGLVYIFMYHNYPSESRYFILSVQNKKVSQIIPLNTAETFQNELENLVFYISNEFDNIDSFVDLIIAKGKSPE